MRDGVADAVRAGGPVRRVTPTALVSFLTAAAFAPLLVPLIGTAGGGEVAAALNQLGGLGGGYLAGVLADVLKRAGRGDRAEPGQAAVVIRADLAEAMRQALEAPGETGAGLRAEVSAVLRQVDAAAAAMAADRDNILIPGFAALGEQFDDFRWVLGDLGSRLTEVQRTLAAQGASQRTHMLAARGELDVITGLLQRVVAAQETQRGPEETGAPEAPEAGGRRDVCPYPGLRAFEGREARWFFGREELTAHVIGRMAEQLDRGAPLLLIGPSGAGKSSLLRAGVIPGLRDGLLPVPGSRHWPRVLVSRPGARPLASLAAVVASRSGKAAPGLRAALDTEPAAAAAALADRLLAGKAADRLLHGNGADRLVMVIDQFEDIFTACQDDTERLQFVGVLLALAARGGLVVLGVRADFYEDCAQVEPLRPLLADNQLVVGPLDEPGLRRAITRPAAATSLVLEPGLTDLMLSDLGLRADGNASYSPGALPLLGYALQATWERRSGRTLTVAGYREAGGIHGAIASEAERIYADFPPATQEVTHRLMLRLVGVGPGAQETRRAVAPGELTSGLDPAAAQAVLARFTQARLMTAGQSSVEITHEAFLAAWPRLREWIAEDRAGLLMHAQIRGDAQAWADMQRDPGSLYRGTRLANARNWRAAGDNESELTGLEREFLDASAGEEDAQRAAAELRRQRERRQNRRLRTLAGGLAVVLAAAIAAGGIAVANARSAANSGKLELSGAFAAQSQNALATNLRTADLDALAGWQADQTATSRSSLLSSEANPYLASLPGVGYEPENLAISPDSRLLAVGGPSGKGGGAGVQVWNLATHDQIADFPGHGPELNGLALSPDGSTLAAAVGSGHGTTVLRFWDVFTREPLPDPVRLAGDMITVSLAYSPDGKILALGGALLASGPGGPRLYPVVELWDLAAHRLLHQLISTAAAPFWSVAFSPDGRLLAAGGQDGTVRLWNVSTGRQQAVLSSSPAVQSVVFSPDGRYLAGSSNNGTVEVWEAPGASAAFSPSVRLTSTAALPRPVAFSAGGQYLYVITGEDVDRWDLVTATLAGVPMRLQHNVTQMLASPDGKTLVLAGGDPDGAYLLDTGGRTFYGASDNPLGAAAISPYGRLTATGGEDGTVQVWPTGDPTATRLLSPRTPGVLETAFSPDGRLLAAGADNCTVSLWNVASSARAAALPAPAGVNVNNTSVVGGSLFSMAFSPDGKTLAAYCSTSGSIPKDTLVVWDTTTAKPAASYIVPHGGFAAGLAYSPDGHVLAVDTGTGTVQFWDTRRHRTVGSIATGEGASPLAVAFSPDGTLLATAGADDRIRLWDVATRKLLAMTGQNTSEFKDLRFSPDGQILAAASQDSVVRLWLVPNLQPYADLTPPTPPVTADSVPPTVNAIAFGPGGRTLVSASNDGTAQVWDLDPADEVSALCDALREPGFAAEWQQLSPSPGPDPCGAG